MDDDMLELLGALSEESHAESRKAQEGEDLHVEEMLAFIDERIALTEAEEYPFYRLCKKLSFDHFTTFALAAALLSSTQTSYASVFQIVNENASLTAPTVESAARLYFGKEFSITAASGHMSVCLENLQPIMDLRVNSNMPFSTVLTPDKRIIDFLFGKNPLRLDENYQRFFHMLTDDKELDPIMANTTQLEAMEISYEQGVRIFSWYGDEGSGRKFFIRQFCKRRASGQSP